MTLPSCFDCQFFTTLDDDTPAACLEPSDRQKCLQGLCRRNPPAVGRFRGEDESLPYDYGQWPLVLSCDWCGAFKPHTKDRFALQGRLQAPWCDSTAKVSD